MKTPHKHAALIKEWADGEQIEYFDKFTKRWVTSMGNSPSWISDTEYRIKPEPKPDIVYYGVFNQVGNAELGSCFTKYNDQGDHIKLTFDGETGKLKAAEVLK
jgi:hypothetical protein